jgi:hypothetical protein
MSLTGFRSGSAQFDDPDPAQSAAASRAAINSRTHDRTGPMLHQRKKDLVNHAPVSTKRFSTFSPRKRSA